jgi:hypothetical protein
VCPPCGNKKERGKDDAKKGTKKLGEIKKSVRRKKKEIAQALVFNSFLPSSSSSFNVIAIR